MKPCTKEYYTTKDNTLWDYPSCLDIQVFEVITKGRFESAIFLSRACLCACLSRQLSAIFGSNPRSGIEKPVIGPQFNEAVKDFRGQFILTSDSQSV